MPPAPSVVHRTGINPFDCRKELIVYKDPKSALQDGRVSYNARAMRGGTRQNMGKDGLSLILEQYFELSRSTAGAVSSRRLLRLEGFTS